MTKRTWAILVGSLLVVVGISASIQAQPPANAGPFGVLNAAIEQVLGIVTGTASDVQDIQATLNDPDSGLQEIKAEVRAIEEMVAASPRIVTVADTFPTSPDAVTLKNLDVLGSLPFGEVRRYSVIVNPSLLVTAPAGTATLEILSGVFRPSDGVVLQTKVLEQDLSALSPLPSAGGTFPTFAGTNTFLRITRSGDGLGVVDFTVNAYIEASH